MLWLSVGVPMTVGNLYHLALTRLTVNPGQDNVSSIISIDWVSDSRHSGERRRELLRPRSKIPYYLLRRYPIGGMIVILGVRLFLLLTWSVIKSILHSITYKSLWPFVTKDLSLRGSPYHIGLYSQRLKTGHVWGIFKVENFIIPQGRQLIILSIFGISKCLWIFSLHWTNIVYGPSPCWWQFFSPRSVCRDGVSEE